MRRLRTLYCGCLGLALLTLASNAVAQSPPLPRSVPPGTGVVRVDPKLQTVIVDGAYQRVTEGVIVVPCGNHQILQRDDLLLDDPSPRRRKITQDALGDAPVVDVPCGDEISVAHRSQRKRRGDAIGRVHGGPGQRTVFGDSIWGADLTASVGLSIDNVDLYILDAQVLIAGTTGGLPVRQYRFGPSVDVEVLSRLRVGGGCSVGGTSIRRATTRRTMGALSFGVHAFASFDVWRVGEHAAFYVLGQISVDSASTFGISRGNREGVPTVSLWGPTLAVGARF
jgi:hypothetical protein